jgi:hypothetical protein
LHRVASGCSLACKSSPPSLSAWPPCRPLADANDLVRPVLCHCSYRKNKPVKTTNSKTLRGKSSFVVSLEILTRSRTWAHVWLLFPCYVPVSVVKFIAIKFPGLVWQINLYQVSQIC